MGGNPSGEIGEGTDGGAEHDAVGALDGLGRVQFDVVGETELHHPVQRCLGAGVDDDLRRDVAALAGDARDRGTDQPDAEKREPLENRISHVIAA